MLSVRKSKIHGRGLFTDEFIPQDTRIMLVADLKRFHQKKNWITKLGRLVNHSRNGNCILKRKEDGTYVMYAKRNIDAGEELTSDYSMLPKPFKSDVTGYK